jgi:mannose-6-phosphate isomerase-like protein (cupin superfamily)
MSRLEETSALPPTAFVVREADVPLESWNDPVRGEVSFRTLLGGADGHSRGLVHGIAYLAAGKIEGAHRHAGTDETIHVLAGSGEARLDGVTMPLAVGDTFFVPSGTVHEWPGGPAGLKFLYSFPADRFDDVAYAFEAGPPPGKAP